jgi:hypothetical protein
MHRATIPLAALNLAIPSPFRRGSYEQASGKTRPALILNRIFRRQPRQPGRRDEAQARPAQNELMPYRSTLRHKLCVRGGADCVAGGGSSDERTRG